MKCRERSGRESYISPTWLRKALNESSCLLPPRPSALLRHESQKLVPGFLLLEFAEHRTCDRARMLFLDTAHHHAEMLCLDNHSHAQRIQHLQQTLSDLLCQPLLNLQSPRKDVHDPWNLAQPDHLV